MTENTVENDGDTKCGSKESHYHRGLYNDMECVVVIGEPLTELFAVNLGIRQGCLLSTMLFNIFLEFVMKELKDLDDNLSL